MKNNWIVIAALMGFLGVALGAFGAHGLQNYLGPQDIETYKTGVFYHLIHSAVLLAIGLSGAERFTKAAAFIFAGIILFSFSLYLYSLTGIKFLAFITPLGGVSFLVGWALIAYYGIRGNSKS
ncbi:MAG: DUF423 domain-containing protein [Ignavibacteria bacterium]|jgi:uncharacterized membrane protein YgdD (TMEM256/DUF423 family)|nr:DUF423 domain-containing protein [Ignavibacteria bacterium]MCU7504365.1 DUF423 domain-containing protein [Ignavibacteria bacterium]MCU7517588.1 DUF423 domain-containing protein [Ignavibacteria bacterium]